MADPLACARTTELVGLCRGVVSDHRLNVVEARYLHQWLLRHPQVMDTPDGAQLFGTLDRCIEDGVLEPDEEDRIVAALTAFADAASTEPTFAEAA